jgi:predicted metalloprotease with PDZ domain
LRLRTELPRVAWIALVVLYGWVAVASLSAAGINPGIESDGDRVTWVMPQSPAWDAGVRPGDTVLATEPYVVGTATRGPVTVASGIPPT